MVPTDVSAYFLVCFIFNSKVIQIKLEYLFFESSVLMFSFYFWQVCPSLKTFSTWSPCDFGGLPIRRLWTSDKRSATWLERSPQLLARRHIPRVQGQGGTERVWNGGMWGILRCLCLYLNVPLILYPSLGSSTQFFELLNILSRNSFVCTHTHTVQFKNSSFCCL